MKQVGCRSRRVAFVAMLALAVAGVRAMAQAPSGTSVAELNNQVVALNQAGRYAEALPIAHRVLTLAEQLRGSDHPEVATSLNNLAELYRALGRYRDAEPLYNRALTIWEMAFGPDDIDVGTALNNLALLYKAEGRLVEAEPLYRRALAIWEKQLGPDHLEVGRALSNLGELYRAQGRYAEAEPLYKRSIEIREKALGPEHAAVATALNNLGLLKSALGRYAEAEPLLKRALAIWESSLGVDHPYVGTAIDNLGEVYRAEGRYAEAEPLYRRSLAIRELALGPDHPYEATTYNNLALLYHAQGRPSDAEPLFKRALAIREKALGPDHPDVAASLNNLAEFYRDQGKLSAAEPLYVRALAIWQKVGGDHPDVATSLYNLANLYLDRGEYAKAEDYYRQALAIRRKALGADHPDVAGVFNNLAWLAFEQSKWPEAIDDWRQSTDVLIGRTRRGSDTVGKGLTGKTRSDAERESYRFVGLIKAAYQLGKAEPAAMNRLGREMFKTMQWAHISDAAGSLAQMAARTAAGDDALARLVRERQDLVDEWYGKDAMLIATHSEAPAERDATAERELAARLAAIDARLREIDGALASDFPSYAAFVQPEALAVEQVQDALNPNEALVLLLDTPDLKPTAEETFVWVVTKTNMRWVRSALGTPSLAREVAALRCGLDYDGNWAAPPRCAKLLGTDYTESDRGQGKSPPFDPERAHALYAALFGKVEDELKDRHLLIVPSGALTQLPFQVLITQKPSTTEDGPELFRRAAWLVKSHALTVLPSVFSLRALRQMAKASHGDRPLIGFGDPLLDGPDASYAEWANSARSRQSCAKAPALRLAAASVERRGVLPLHLDSGVADVTQIRAQVPLPETADELCAVADALGARGDEIRLGERATEAEIKRLNAAGELAKYRVIHFATHAALAGQVSSNSEPGLLLTPPSTATALDDGYLSASEIAALNLDADWIILSACNTAAGGAQGAEAFSGLARAFFYAGSRALLVSHWAVDSDATIKLITKTLSAMADDKSIGRSEALRRSMLALIENGEPQQAHPAIWAPFVVVGEGSGSATTLMTSSIAPGPEANRLKARFRPKKQPEPKFQDWQLKIWRQSQ
jgi:CHAT domain-containing protein/tetratricopeptide (TPR) repeat protein